MTVPDNRAIIYTYKRIEVAKVAEIGDKIYREYISDPGEWVRNGTIWGSPPSSLHPGPEDVVYCQRARPVAVRLEPTYPKPMECCIACGHDKCFCVCSQIVNTGNK